MVRCELSVTFSSRARSTLTSSRYNNDTWSCMLTNFVHPFFSATAFKCANSQHRIALAPMYLTLPATTKSCSAFMVSSAGTVGSKRWIW